jgi:hypothetical protein
MFWPTIMIGKSAYCKKLLESHTTTTYVPYLIAIQSR